jgi:hypothetical protein
MDSTSITSGIIDLGAGTDSLTLEGTLNSVRVSNVETVIGGVGSDAVTNGGSNAVTFLAGGGNDHIWGGGAGTDRITYNGASTDYAYAANANGSITLFDMRSGSPDGMARASSPRGG